MADEDSDSEDDYYGGTQYYGLWSISVIYIYDELFRLGKIEKEIY